MSKKDLLSEKNSSKLNVKKKKNANNRNKINLIRVKLKYFF